MMLLSEPSQATLLFIIIFVWFLAFCFNECRQLLLAVKNNDVMGSFFTLGLAGNVVDLVTYTFLGFAFGFHFKSIHAYADDNPERPSVIFPIRNNDQLNSYCPFNLPRTLMVAQASYR